MCNLDVLLCRLIFFYYRFCPDSNWCNGYEFYRSCYSFSRLRRSGLSTSCLCAGVVSPVGKKGFRVVIHHWWFCSSSTVSNGSSPSHYHPSLSQRRQTGSWVCPYNNIVIKPACFIPSYNAHHCVNGSSMLSEQREIPWFLCI